MAVAEKKKITVDVKLNPFSECKGKTAPDWFEARPKLKKLVTPIEINQTLELDTRKWSKKKLEDGVYAVARYELALFASSLVAMEKDIDKAKPKGEKKKKKYTANAKDESKEEGAALSTAEAKVKKLYTRISKAIDDKVSLALEEVEKGGADNKKALAAGKEALKRLDKLDLDGLFEEPVDEVSKALEPLYAALEDGKEDTSKELKTATGNLKKADGAFERKAKEVQNVLKFVQSVAGKITKSKDVDPGIVAVGEKMKDGRTKTAVATLLKEIDQFDAEIAKISKTVKDGKLTAKMADDYVGSLYSNLGRQKSVLKQTKGAIQDIGKAYTAAAKAAKK